MLSRLIDHWTRRIQRIKKSQEKWAEERKQESLKYEKEKEQRKINKLMKKQLLMQRETKLKVHVKLGLKNQNKKLIL